MFFCYECCVLSGRDLCDELITRTEESYRLRCVVVCDLETSIMSKARPALGSSATGKKIQFPSTVCCFELSFQLYYHINWVLIKDINAIITMKIKQKCISNKRGVHDLMKYNTFTCK